MAISYWKYFCFYGLDISFYGMVLAINDIFSIVFYILVENVIMTVYKKYTCFKPKKNQIYRNSYFLILEEVDTSIIKLNPDSSIIKCFNINHDYISFIEHPNQLINLFTEVNLDVSFVNEIKTKQNKTFKINEMYTLISTENNLEVCLIANIIRVKYKFKNHFIIEIFNIETNQLNYYAEGFLGLMKKI